MDGGTRASFLVTPLIRQVRFNHVLIGRDINWGSLGVHVWVLDVRAGPAVHFREGCGALLASSVLRRVLPKVPLGAELLQGVHPLAGTSLPNGLPQIVLVFAAHSRARPKMPMALVVLFVKLLVKVDLGGVGERSHDGG